MKKFLYGTGGNGFIWYRGSSYYQLKSFDHETGISQVATFFLNFANLGFDLLYFDSLPANIHFQEDEYATTFLTPKGLKYIVYNDKDILIYKKGETVTIPYNQNGSFLTSTWDPSGSYIYYATIKTDKITETTCLWQFNEETSATKEIFCQTDNFSPRALDTLLRFSPDGRYLALLNSQGEKQIANTIYVFDCSNQKRIKLIGSVTLAYAHGLTWNPESTWIATIANPNKTSGIYVFNKNGKELGLAYTNRQWNINGVNENIDLLGWSIK